MGVLLQIAVCRRALLQTGNLCRRAEALHAQPQTACAGAEVEHPGCLHPSQHSGGGFGYHLSIGPGAEHAGADSQLKVKEGPAAAKVLQRLPGRTAGRQGFQPLCLLCTQRSIGKAGIPARCQPEELGRVKICVGAACGAQACLHLPDCCPGQHPCGYHLPSSGSSGRTGVTAAMATSIMLSSGSNTVRCCTQMPGCRMMRVAMLSDRPHHLSSS